MDRLTPELYRILLKRVGKALYAAKYTPATVGGWDGHERVAAEVLLPYAPLPVADGKVKHEDRRKLPASGRRNPLALFPGSPDLDGKRKGGDRRKNGELK